MANGLIQEKQGWFNIRESVYITHYLTKFHLRSQLKNNKTGIDRYILNTFTLAPKPASFLM